MAGSGYLSKSDWIAAGLAFGIALLLYLATLAPTVTLEASGQLVVAADHLGVARPPGYPVWTLLAKGFIGLFPFARYHGHPNPAWAVHLFSALCGALACGLLALLTARTARDLAPSRAIAAVSGVAAGLLFAASPVLWSQAVIAETHALTTFYFLLLLALSLRWIAAPDARAPFLLAFLAGLGLSVSQLLILFLPVLLLAAAFVSLRDFARLAAAALLFGAFLLAEFTWGRLRPAWGAAGLGLVLALAALLAIHRATRPVAGLLLLLLAGLLPQLYLPLASAHHPPMNMGQAHTWTGFWHVVGRGQFEALAPLDPFANPLVFLRDLAWYARLAAAQFTAPLAALALLPALALPWLPRPAWPPILLVLAAFLGFAPVVIIGANPALDIQNTFVLRTAFLPSFALLAGLIGLALALLLRALSRLAAPNQPTPEEPRP